MICLPCVPSVVAIKRIITFSDQPEILLVYVPYMEYGRTHQHSRRRARQTHQKIRNNVAKPVHSSKKRSAVQVVATRAVRSLLNPAMG